MGKHVPEFVVPAAPLDYFAPGYPNEISQKWWKEVGEFYNNQAKAAFAAATARAVAAGDESKFSSTANGSVNADQGFKHLSLNKPLPALPQPYFEYLFADAGIDDKIAKKALNVFVNTVTTPYNCTPDVTVDMSGFSQYVFHQANVPIVTKDAVNNTPVVYIELAATTSTTVASTPDTGEQFRLQKEKEVDDSLESLEVEISAIVTPNHRPAVDIRLGPNKEPQAWIDPKETPKGLAEAEPGLLDCAMLGLGKNVGPFEAIDVLLKPVTYKPLEIKTGIKNITAKWIEHRQLKGQSTTIDTSAQNSTTSLKRHAHNSWATRSATSGSDESVKYLGTKRVCNNSTVEAVNANNDIPVEAGIFFPPGIQAGIDIPTALERPVSIIDLTAESLGGTPMPVIVDLVTPTTPAPPTYTPIDTHIPTPLTDNYKAFPGQFVGIGLNMLGAKTKIGAMKKPKVMVFGDYTHANGPIIHKNCYPAPTSPEWNYTPETLPRHSTLFRSMEDLDIYMELAASHRVSLLRNPSQENLRREAHMELASARLEGVCVGQFRYYQGHLSVEEYVDKGLCVCWSPCACSRVCSRFGDVMCPCGADLELQDDSDNASEL